MDTWRDKHQGTLNDNRSRTEETGTTAFGLVRKSPGHLTRLQSLGKFGTLSEIGVETTVTGHIVFCVRNQDTTTDYASGIGHGYLLRNHFTRKPSKAWLVTPETSWFDIWKS